MCPALCEKHIHEYSFRWFYNKKYIYIYSLCSVAWQVLVLCWVFGTQHWCCYSPWFSLKVWKAVLKWLQYQTTINTCVLEQLCFHREINNTLHLSSSEILVKKKRIFFFSPGKGKLDKVKCVFGDLTLTSYWLWYDNKTKADAIKQWSLNFCSEKM